MKPGAVSVVYHRGKVDTSDKASMGGFREVNDKSPAIVNNLVRRENDFVLLTKPSNPINYFSGENLLSSFYKLIQ